MSKDNKDNKGDTLPNIPSVSNALAAAHFQARALELRLARAVKSATGKDSRAAGIAELEAQVSSLSARMGALK